MTNGDAVYLKVVFLRFPRLRSLDCFLRVINTCLGELLLVGSS